MQNVIVETFVRALRKFVAIQGWQAAAAFANYAFFSLFPLILLCVAVASFFVDHERAGSEVIAYVKTYMPITGPMQTSVFDTITGVVRARGQAGVVAFLLLIWSAQQFFATLITATNQAWGLVAYRWWQVPLKCLELLAILVGAVLVGIGMPALAQRGGEVVPLLVVFFSLSVFYRLVPNQPTGFASVWVGALCATALLRLGQACFVIYFHHFAPVNVVYGAFGGVMALLLWIYYSGAIVLFGACLCAVQAEGLSSRDTREDSPLV